MTFLSVFRNVSDQYLKLHHERFLSDPFQLIVTHTILRNVVQAAVSVVKWTIRFTLVCCACVANSRMRTSPVPGIHVGTCARTPEETVCTCPKIFFRYGAFALNKTHRLVTHDRWEIYIVCICFSIGSSNGRLRTLRITGSSTLSKTRRFGKWICFLPQVRGEPTLLGLLERANLNQVIVIDWV
jgi:hypothetical protein